MSKIGKKAVAVPKGVTATIEGSEFKAKGPKGELRLPLSDKVATKIDNGVISVAVTGETKEHKAAWGFTRAMIANLIEGVDKGYEKKLEITGVGYRAAVQGKNLQLALGYSHDVSLRFRKASRSRRRSRPRSSCRASTSRRSGRSRPRSAASVRRSPTRARACAMPANSSSARKARRSDDEP
jgi:hypothetical protein